MSLSISFARYQQVRAAFGVSTLAEASQRDGAMFLQPQSFLDSAARPVLPRYVAVVRCQVPKVLDVRSFKITNDFCLGLSIVSGDHFPYPALGRELSD